MGSYGYAVTTLLENRVNSLPITGDILKEMLRRLHWELVFFAPDDEASINLLNELSISEFAEKYKAFSFRKDGCQIVFVKRGLSTDYTNYLLAHELGHIVMGHFSDTGILGKHNGQIYDEQQETEADEFARNILAPICILKKMHIKNVDELEQYTSLKDEALKAHYTEYKNYRAVLNENEHILIGNFRNYIKNHMKQNKKKQLFIAVLSAFLILFLSLATFKAITYSNKTPVDNYVSESIRQSEPQNENEGVKSNQSINSQQIIVNGTEYNRSMTVFKTQTGSKFHRESCKHIVNRSGVTQMSIETAIAAGIEPCNDCF